VKSGSKLADLSIQSRRDDLEKHLGRIGRPIVVIIDDVDRLPPEHVCIVFQMLKAVCDFERVAYLVAYDPEPVNQALSYRETYDGKKYLEKIVQVSYPLPRLPFTHMKKYLREHIEALAKRHSINLTATEAQIFGILLNKTDLVRTLDTPRDVVRLCNRLQVSAPNTKGEVCFADLVAFEVLELKFPEVASIIRTEPDRFVAVFHSDEEFYSNDSLTAFYHFAKEEKDETIPIDRLFQEINYNGREKDRAEGLLLFLFPRLGGKNYHEADMPETINRVRNRDAFLKLLHCGVMSFTYSSEEARRFCMKPEERQQILADHRDADDLYNWLSYLEPIAIESEIEDPLQLCDVLLDEMRGPGEGGVIHGLARYVGEFLYEVIRSRIDRTIRWGMLKRLVSSRLSLAVSEYTLIKFLSKFGIWQKGKYIPNQDTACAGLKGITTEESSLFLYEQLYLAKDKWLANVRDVAVSEGLMETQKDLISILFRWGQLNDNNFSEPQAYVMKSSISPTWLKSFLRYFDPDTNGYEMLPFIPDEALGIFIDRVASLAKSDENASAIADFLKQTQKAKAEKENPES